MFDAPRTPNTGYVLAFATNITAQATASVVTAQSGVPAAVANEIAIVEEAPPNNLNIQLWGATGATLQLRVMGWRKETRTGLWMPSALLQATVVMHGSGYSLSMNGDTLFPAKTHTINLNNANAKALDGDATYKMPGSISLDCHGFQKIGIGLTTSSGTAKANAAQAGY